MEMFNLTRNRSMVNSTVCGGSRTCMCVRTDNLPTTYLLIRAFTLENDKTLSEISLPVTLNNSQSNEEIVRECIQLFAQPLVAGGLTAGTELCTQTHAYTHALAFTHTHTHTHTHTRRNCWHSGIVRNYPCNSCASCSLYGMQNVPFLL